MLKKIVLSFTILCGFSSSYSQDSISKANPTGPTISGYVDVYYRVNLSNPKGGITNSLTSFTNSINSFELNMASVKLEHAIGKVSGVIDLGFGKRAEEFSYNDANSRFAIKQLYVSYSPCSTLKLTAGSWATHVGYELVDPYLNRNYSMSYMFSYGPFFHTGAKAEFSFGKSGVMIGFANPTDFKTAINSNKFLIGQFSTTTKDDKSKLYLNYQGGKPNDSTKINQIDLVVTEAISSKVSLGLNATTYMAKGRKNGKYGSTNSWSGAALYINVDPTPKFGLTLRSEYFDDKKTITSIFASQPIGGNIFANTLSANFKIDNLTFIPEIRVENASQSLYTKENGSSAKTTASIVFAAVYKF